MVSPFAKVQSDALATVRATAGASITYTRGSNSASVVAVPGSSDFSVVSGDLVAETIKSPDFLINAAELSVAMIAGGESSFTEPLRGDLVVDDDGRTFVVMPDKSVPAWEYGDRDGRKWFRVHTKRAE